MKKIAFTFVEVIVSLLLISLLLVLVSSTSSALMNFEKKQETQISGNEYINYLRKKALAYKNGLETESFYDNNLDIIADEFYENYHPQKDFPHQIAAPTVETPIATDGVTLYVYHFHLLNSKETTNKSTESIFAFSAN
jgi:type II secretory pathway pseudopilin PulG